jgi:hypothetical protein
MHEERRQRLAEFTSWAAEHITGDEKGESQLFLDRLGAAARTVRFYHQGHEGH